MSPEEIISTLEPSKREDAHALHDLVRKTLPKLDVVVKDGMVGYGPYRYRYDSGREGDSFRVCWKANKAGISLYVTAVDEGGWIVEQAAERLGKVSTGKSCIRMKRLADVERGALIEVLRRVKDTKGPGEIAVSTAKTSAKKKGA